MRAIAVVCALSALLMAGGSQAVDDMDGQMVRLARLVIDPARLTEYNVALKEEIEASVRLEPGVLTLYAVSEKERPTHITILEIYANRAAYEKHVKAPHFLKYKTSTAQMVKSLELVDSVPLVPAMKIK